MILETRDLTKRYGQKEALSALSLGFFDSGVYGIVGPNGSGKSTMLNILATLTKPTAGTVTLDGTDIVKKPNAMREVLGYLPQTVAVYPNLTAVEYLGYIAGIKGISPKDAKRQVDGLLSTLNLAQTGKARLSQFSGGMRQRVGLAAALLGDPKIILVDEPTVGLDPTERVALRNLLSMLAKDRMVLMSSHIVSDIESMASRICVLSMGHLLFMGDARDLVSAADSHVWTLEVPGHEALDAFDRSQISSILQTENGLRVKVVSEEKPAGFAQQTQATLEDACLYCISRQGGKDDA